MSDQTNATAPMSLPAPRPECQEACDCPDNHRRACWEMHNPVWPPTSERDAHLGAYQQHAREPQPLELELPLLRVADPAPSGLTAAQEIRLRLLENLNDVPLKPDDEMTLEDLPEILSPLAAWVEHGERVKVAPDTAACPDPSLHDEIHPLHQIADQALAARNDYAARLMATDQALAVVVAERDEARERVDRVLRDRDQVAEEFRRGLADLRAESTKAHERVAELERQRDAVLALLDHLDGLDSRVGHEEIRAIYAEHGDEERGHGS